VGAAALQSREQASPVTLVRWTHGLVNRIVAAGDVLSLVLPALLLVLVPELFPSPLTWQQVAVVTAVQVWAFLSVMRGMEAYRVEYYHTFWLQHGQLIAGFAVASFVALLTLQACVSAVQTTERWFLVWQGLQLALLILIRQFQAVHVLIVNRRRILQRRVVIIGANEVASRIVRELKQADRRAQFDVVAVFRTESDDPTVTQVAEQPVLGDLDMLTAFAQDHGIDLIVLAKPWAQAREMFRLVPRIEWIAADVVIPFDSEDLRPSLARLMPLGPLSTLQVASRPFKGTQGLLKLLEDYVVASAALILLSPLMLLIALLIKLDSPGPVIFLQPRTGFSQKPFWIWKFRTMTVDPTDDGSVGTQSRHDRRITRVGGILRRLSLDELPQLINVLRGEMSIVGPRPYVSNMLVGQDRFSELVRRYAVRHRIKPGLTGWAQANGLRSAALRDPDNARRSIEMDLWYITHWSLGLDIRIMLQTIATGLSGRNVY
jgi:putative colanic acid biosynthesis UDP-glucose lipid carrier transferase